MSRILQPFKNEAENSSVLVIDGAPGLKLNWLGSTILTGRTCMAIFGIAGVIFLNAGSSAYALPAGGTVAAGAASIASDKSAVTIEQSTQNAVINWQSFGIAKDEAVTFVQPNRTSVALNRVLGADPSAILGSLSANGEIFLVNPNGILFGKGAQVNVAGLVASTLDITDANFMAGDYQFAGSSSRAIVNRGYIDADGGYVAMLGAKVDNQGVISARLGTAVLAAGSAITLDVAGDGLLNVSVDQGAVNALVKNGGLIKADGGKVVMTAKSAGQLMKSAVNNTGVIEAQTIETHDGTISLLGDDQNGVVNESGTLDASAPNGGNGGKIETSAAQVNVTTTAKVTTAAPKGVTGTWLIDPVDFTIAPTGGNISGATLSALLVTNSVVISTLAAATSGTVAGAPPVTSYNSTTSGNGDINVNDTISWAASPTTTTLTLDAARDVNINGAISATNGNFVVCCGRDINLSASLTTTNGSILLNAGRDLNLTAAGSITATDGNITLCAGNNVNESARIVLTRGANSPAQSLGLATGLVIIAGNDGTGPGTAGGTLIFPSSTSYITVTGPNAPVAVYYNPPSYAAPTVYSPNFTLTLGAALTEYMLVFPSATKTADGTTAATLSGFNSTATSGLPIGVTLVAGPGATATYDSPDAGTGIGITYSGYSLGGANSGQYALAANCCVTGFRTSGTILAATSTSTGTSTGAGTGTSTTTGAGTGTGTTTSTTTGAGTGTGTTTSTTTGAGTGTGTTTSTTTGAGTGTGTTTSTTTGAGAGTVTATSTTTGAGTGTGTTTSTTTGAGTGTGTTTSTTTGAGAGTVTAASTTTGAGTVTSTGTGIGALRNVPTPAAFSPAFAVVIPLFASLAMEPTEPGLTIPAGGVAMPPPPAQPEAPVAPVAAPLFMPKQDRY